jgi:hypothetical protein
LAASSAAGSVRNRRTAEGLVQGVLADHLAQGGLAIWLMAAATLSIATTDLVASTT